MEATKERTTKAEAEIEKSEDEQIAEALAKSYKDNEWWAVEFNFTGEDVMAYRPTFWDICELMKDKKAKAKSMYIIKEREEWEELTVYLMLTPHWAESGSYGNDEQKLVAVVKAGAYASAEIEEMYEKACAAAAEGVAEGTAEKRNESRKLWKWKQNLGGMVEKAVRMIVRWMR